MAQLELGKANEKKKALPLVMALGSMIVDEIGLVDAINESAQWDRAHWQLSPGALAKSIVLSTFSDIRAPLSSLAERLEGCDLEYMLG